MNQRSNIGTSLNKKRHMSLVKKISVYFIFIMFFISLAILGLTKDQVRIKDIKVSGNSSISTDDLLKIVEDEINKIYSWIIPTDNILLLRRSEIINQILAKYKKIGSVKISIKAVDKIELSITERESKNLWCKGKPIDSRICYFMDSDGFIFENAPIFSEGAFPEYFGLIFEANPIGKYYFNNNFKTISNLYSLLNKTSFIPSYFYANDLHDYEIYLLNGGKILINDKKSFDSSLLNLQALVNSGYIKDDFESIKKIKYIDLRFGNKVNFELIK